MSSLPRRRLLSDFFHEAGRVASPFLWSRTWITKIGEAKPETKKGASEAGAYHIRDDIIAACAAGLIRASCNGKIVEKTPLRVKPVQKENDALAAAAPAADDDSDEEEEEEDDELGIAQIDRPQAAEVLTTSAPATTPLVRVEEDVRPVRLNRRVDARFKILPSFWRDTALIGTINWPRSEVRIPEIYLIEMPTGPRVIVRRSRNRWLADEPVEERTIPAQLVRIYIEEPQEALSALYLTIELPDDDWFERYRKYRSPFIKELVTVAWRYLAIKNPKPDRGLVTEVQNHLREYLAMNWPAGPSEGTSPVSEASLNNIASRVCNEWRAGDVMESVLINTSRPPKT